MPGSWESQLHAVLSVSATAQGRRSAYFTTQGLPLNVMIAWLLMLHLRWGCTWLALQREKKNLSKCCARKRAKDPQKKINSMLQKKIGTQRRYKSIYESHPLCNPGEVGAVCACFERQWHAVRIKVFATTRESAGIRRRRRNYAAAASTNFSFPWLPTAATQEGFSGSSFVSSDHHNSIHDRQNVEIKSTFPSSPVGKYKGIV